MKDLFEQWKYAAFTAGSDSRGFYLATIVGIPLVFILGIALIVARFVLKVATSQFLTIGAIACPILAILCFIAVLFVLKNS